MWVKSVPWSAVILVRSCHGVHTCTSRLNEGCTHTQTKHTTTARRHKQHRRMSMLLVPLPSPRQSPRSVELFSPEPTGFTFSCSHNNSSSSRSQFHSSGSPCNYSRSHCKCSRCIQLTVRLTPALAELLNASLSIRASERSNDSTLSPLPRIPASSPLNRHHHQHSCTGVAFSVRQR